MKTKVLKFLSILLCFIIILSSFSIAVSAASEGSSYNISIFDVVDNTTGSSLSFEYSNDSLSFSKGSSSIYIVKFIIHGLSSSELLDGSFTFSCHYSSGLLSTVPTRFNLRGFNGVSYDVIGSVILNGNRADFIVDSGSILSDYSHFSFSFGISTATDNIVSLSISNVAVFINPHSMGGFLSDISIFFSSSFSFLLSVLSLIVSTPALLCFFSFVVIGFVLLIFYRVKRHE